jgi:lipopolysaccharide export system protein LptA
MMLATVLARAVRAEEARAATHPPATAKSAVANPDSLLGALSFTAGHEPISLSADGLEFDYRARVLTYKGNVVAIQGDMKLESNVLTITLAESDAKGQSSTNQLREVVATGNVRLSKGERTATAGRAVFDQARRTAVLSENAVLRDGPNQVTGERVVVYLDEARSVVEGGSRRVQAVLFPPNGEATPSPRAAAATDAP